MNMILYCIICMVTWFKCILKRNTIQKYYRCIFLVYGFKSLKSVHLLRLWNPWIGSNVNYWHNYFDVWSLLLGAIMTCIYIYIYIYIYKRIHIHKNESFYVGYHDIISLPCLQSVGWFRHNEMKDYCLKINFPTIK